MSANCPKSKCTMYSAAVRNPFCECDPLLSFKGKLKLRQVAEFVSHVLLLSSTAVIEHRVYWVLRQLLCSVGKRCHNNEWKAYRCRVAACLVAPSKTLKKRFNSRCGTQIVFWRCEIECSYICEFALWSTIWHLDRMVCPPPPPCTQHIHNRTLTCGVE